ncbi:hypothetical protein NBRC10512_005475 [Rhodotorula toruloides]|uniref:RHTO0S22e00958g1_1 n=2 Tax=Rhodotorula toruloides TaxID=5286 RepID=A0A061BPM0_RHOTO|nr:Initiation factor 2B-related protein [Rhodotorula toruloides NP11]EMS18902.1 Initiation factor 2B-related protein [Rhodotorula toruloides NP11]CDR48999.1 RHTO0S22e00958g1_1 [Rhodotorula toruloides]
MSESYERGLEIAFAEAAGQEFEKTEQRERDQAMYLIAESRLGRWTHEWQAIGEVEKDPTTLKPEHVSTAFSSVILPDLLDEALYLLSSLPALSALDACDIALNAFVQLVEARVGAGAFRGSWPAHVPPPTLATLDLPDNVVKYRLMLYWRDVVAHQFGIATPAHAASLAALFLRLLLPLKAPCLSPQTSLDTFVRAAKEAAVSEAARVRLAAANIEKLGVAKILERAAREKRPVLRVVVAGNNPLLFGVLRELVHYVSTISAHPYASVNPHIHALTRALEVEWASQPNVLHITVAESRPLCSGAVLASRLWNVATTSRERATQLRALATSYENPYLHHPLSPGPTATQLPNGLLGRLAHEMGVETEDALGETGETYGRLNRLLKQAEPRVLGQPPPAGIGGAKVKVEVAPDNALGAVLKATKAEKGAGQAVVLLAAEAILPGKAGDVVAEMGSWMLADMATKQGAKVFVIATSDTILPPSNPSPPLANHDPTELLAGWSGTLAAETNDLDGFARALADEGQPDLSVVTAASEVVPGGLIDGYITDKGFLSAAGCAVLGAERGDAEKQLLDL